MKEVLDFHKDRISKSMILQKLKLNKDEFFVVSIHREENVDHKTHLAALMGSVNALCDKYDLPVIVSTHPRTRKRIISFKRLKIHKKVMLLKPFGFIDYLKLQSNAFCVISDSGTISEESAILSFPAITVRNAMERPEAMDTGNIILTGLNQAAILNAVEYVAREKGALASYKIPFEYKINNTSARVLKLILGTARLSHLWDGIHIE
jgi:UDP-N-acetylglucosamine 2-epimerase (non-hydrolysing)